MQLALPNNWSIYSSIDKLSEQLACNILNIAKKSIEQNDCFSIVLTGGQSILALYSILSKSSSDWSKWHVYIGDERCLIKNHKDRNDRIINEIWLDNSAIPKDNIYFIKAEMGLLKARREYEKILMRVDKFDVVLLSVGEDGHIASLFPGRTYPNNQHIVIERNSPKPPAQRISMSYDRLRASENMFVIIIGELKQNLVKLIIEGVNLPVNKLINGAERFFIHRNTIEGNELNPESETSFSKRPLLRDFE
jgi:6-phosphogluconolactonase